MTKRKIPLTFDEWVERCEGSPPPTDDEFGRTAEGEVLDTLEKVQKVLEQHRRRQERLARDRGWAGSSDLDPC